MMYAVKECAISLCVIHVGLHRPQLMHPIRYSKCKCLWKGETFLEQGGVSGRGGSTFFVFMEQDRAGAQKFQGSSDLVIIPELCRRAAAFHVLPQEGSLGE